MKFKTFTLFENLFKIPLRNGLTKPKAVRGEGTRMVNMGELFANERLVNTPMERVPTTKLEFEKNKLEEGDLLFARQSLVLSGAGKCSIFLKDEEDVVFESHLIRCRLDQKLADSSFYQYYFSSRQGRSKIESIVEQVAAAGIRGSDLAKIEVIHPLLSEQKAIANILGTFDKKIELNKQTNETLEEIAKTLFRSWFIDFDPVKAKAEGRSTGLPDEISDLFPDSFEDSEIGNVPKNWDVKKLGNIISIKYGKNFPTKNLSESGFPVFGGNGIIGYHSSFLYKEEMTLMSCRGAASGSILRTLPKSFVTNNSLVMDHTSNKFPSQRYVEYFLQSTDRRGFITGSAQPQVTIDSIYDLSFLVPNYQLVEYFQTLITPLNQKSLLIMKQNKNLELLRNTLLPKLISGELRIPDAEKMIEEAEI